MGKFVKGQSGNPGGRKGTVVNGVCITDLAKSHCPEAIETLVEIMRDKGAPQTARKAAADSLLDRGIGKPLQKAELTGAEGKDLMPTNTAEAARELVTTLAELERLGVIKLPE